MRILHALDHSLPLHSGYTFRSQNILRAQRKRGWEVAVATSPKQHESWKGGWLPCEEIEDISYFRSGPATVGKCPFQSVMLLMAKFRKRLLSVTTEWRPDLLHAHSPVLNFFPAQRVARQHGLPLVYEIRAFWEDAAVDHGTYREDSWRYRHRPHPGDACLPQGRALRETGLAVLRGGLLRILNRPALVEMTGFHPDPFSRRPLPTAEQ